MVLFLKSPIFTVCLLASLLVCSQNQQLDSVWPTLHFTLINERTIEISQKYEFSLHTLQTDSEISKQYIIEKYSEDYKAFVNELRMEINAGVLRMYSKNKALKVYEGYNVRLLPAINRLSFLHLGKQIVELQILYQLAFGVDAEYQTIGMSYFISGTQKQTEAPARDFYQEIESIFEENMSTNKSKHFSVQKYFPLPQPKELQNLYVYRAKEVDEKTLWSIRPKILEIPEQDFRSLKKFLRIQTGKGLQISSDSIRNVYAVKIRPFKSQKIAKVQSVGKNIEQQRECSSDDKEVMSDEL